jgi:murein L,D-transpeptidase YafK
MLGVLLLFLAGCSAVQGSFSSSPPIPVGLVFDRMPLHEGRWLLVDSKRQTVTVYQDERPLKTFTNVAFGVAGAGQKQRRGDGVTPIGRFTITDIRPSQRFRHFMALSYPTLSYAERALREGRISVQTYRQIKEAFVRGVAPPQNTALGGDIGLHGVGRGDITIHHSVDWTDGCVALENEQVDQLVRLVRPNMVVEIR